ncbi:Crp/Fnr family transcriptional regulator, partial [Methylobacterium sp. J-030]|nr:Crp/Fnr family transcriptional regulator [Methylobacterium sp. J-030]
MQQALTRKLESFEPLSDQARWALNGLVLKVRQVGARQDLIQEGDKPDNVLLILDGFACRYKVLPDGQRQIMAL